MTPDRHDVARRYRRAADQVTVRVADGGIGRLASWCERAGGSGTVEVGDSIELQDAIPGVTITLTWTSADGSETAVITQTTV